MAKKIVVVVGGGLARGKSTVAQYLLEQLGGKLALKEFGKVHATDWIREELSKKGLLSSTRIKGVNKGIFSQEDRKKVYDELVRRVDRDLKNNGVAVVSGTFIEKEQREKLYESARKNGALVVLVECLASSAEAKRRLKAAEEKGLERFGSVVDLKRYEKLEKNVETKRLTESPSMVRLKKKGGKTIIAEESLKEFEENNAKYVPFFTGFKEELLRERTRMLAERILDFAARVRCTKR